MVTMDIYGHLFPSETDKLAAALDDLYNDSVTDKQRTQPAFGAPAQEGGGAETRTGKGLLSAPGVGLEPTTNGLTVRSRRFRERCRVGPIRRNTLWHKGFRPATVLNVFRQLRMFRALSRPIRAPDSDAAGHHGEGYRDSRRRLRCSS